jgi:hypothetical protein
VTVLFLRQTLETEALVLCARHHNKHSRRILKFHLSIYTKPLLAILAFAQDSLCLVGTSELCGAVVDFLALAKFTGDDALAAKDLFQGIEG